jgi:hypothetical protein
MNPKRISTTVLLLCASLSSLAWAEIDPTVQALRQLEQSIASGQIAQAESQLQTLRGKIPGDTRLQAAEREIAGAYVSQGQAALAKGDLQGASQAVQKADSLGPAGAAQGQALAQAIEKETRAQEAARAAAAAAEAEARAAAAREEQARQQRLAAERKAAEEAEQAAAAAAALAASEPAAPQAQLINPAAPSSIAMPMLDAKDNASLRELLDKVAADIVNFNCTVQVGVRAGKDYPWVAALLSARVKALDPDFSLQLSQQIEPDSEPSLLLTPQS